MSEEIFDIAKKSEAGARNTMNDVSPAIHGAGNSASIKSAALAAANSSLLLGRTGHDSVGINKTDGTISDGTYYSDEGEDCRGKKRAAPPLTTAEEKRYDKRIARVMANRRSAKESRERRKRLQAHLESSVAKLTSDHEVLMRENKELRGHVVAALEMHRWTAATGTSKASIDEAMRVANAAPTPTITPTTSAAMVAAARSAVGKLGRHQQQQTQVVDVARLEQQVRLLLQQQHQQQAGVGSPSVLAAANAASICRATSAVIPRFAAPNAAAAAGHANVASPGQLVSVDPTMAKKIAAVMAQIERNSPPGNASVEDTARAASSCLTGNAPRVAHVNPTALLSSVAAAASCQAAANAHQGAQANPAVSPCPFTALPAAAGIQVPAPAAAASGSSGALVAALLAARKLKL